MFSGLLHWVFPGESNNQRAKLLHPSAIGIIIGAFVLFQLVLGRLSANYPQILGYAAVISPTDVARLTNERRLTAGLGELKLDEQLSAAAAQKAADMFARDYWAHVSPVGTQPWTFITEAGYQYRYAGENLARDFSDADSIIKAWMNSPTHRDNILNSRYQNIGIAVVDGILGGRETTVVVQLFGTRLTTGAAPAVSKAAVTTVKAAEASPSLMPSPAVVAASASPFDITKGVTIALLAVFIVVLAIDLVAVSKRKIMRWTSKSLAHLALLASLLIAAILASQGQIL